MERSELQAKIADLEQQIAELPAGSVTKKTINGNAYFYHRWTEDKKRREKYIEPLPDKRTVKKYKVFPASSHMCCWPLFMRQDRVCAFPSGSTHPDYAAPA